MSRLVSPSLHVVLVLRSNDHLSSYFMHEVVKDALTHNSRNVLIHVVSPLGSPLYLRQLRNFLLTNIHLSISVKYVGPDLGVVKELLKKIQDFEKAVVRIYVSSESRRELSQELEGLGVPYVVLGEG
ncbi:MAG: DUF5751 family protein [Zestosphaera sp.]